MLLISLFRLIGENVELLSNRRFNRGIYGLLLLLVFSVFIILPLGADETHPQEQKKGEDLPPTTPPKGQDNSEHSAQDNTQSPSENDVSSGKDEAQANAVKLYRKLFKQIRASQLEAIRKLLQLGSYEKQFKMIKLIMTKVVEVFLDSRIKLMEGGFTPGDTFPTVETVRDALSSVLENTVFLGEIVLRLPDVSHALLRNNTEWQMTVHWAVEFSNDTKILSGNEELLLSLMAQELGIIEKSPDFINPYRQDAQLEKILEEEAEELLKEKMKEKKKKERQEKKKQRGPKLTPARRNEL